MDRLRVRVYNVRFGDAILITVPEEVDGGSTEIRHILLDVGNAKASRKGGEGHDDDCSPTTGCRKGMVKKIFET